MSRRQNNRFVDDIGAHSGSDTSGGDDEEDDADDMSVDQNGNVANLVVDADEDEDDDESESSADGDAPLPRNDDADEEGANGFLGITAAHFPASNPAASAPDASVPMDMDMDADGPGPYREAAAGAASAGVPETQASAIENAGDQLDPSKWPDFRLQPEAQGISYSIHAFDAIFADLVRQSAETGLQRALVELDEFYRYLDLDKPVPQQRTAIWYLIAKMYPNTGEGASYAATMHITQHWRFRIGSLMAMFDFLHEATKYDAVWEQERIINRLNQIAQTVSACAIIAEQMDIAGQARNQCWTPELSPTAPLVWFDRSALADYCTPFQRSLLKVYQSLRAHGYRVAHGNVYAPKIVDHEFVHVFSKLETVEDFVTAQLLAEDSNEDWIHSTHQAKTCADVIDHFKQYGHLTLPPMVISRYLFAFKNGVFDIRSCELVPHRQVRTDQLCANFFDQVLPPSVVAVLDAPFFRLGKDPRTEADSKDYQFRLPKTVKPGEVDPNPDPTDWFTTIPTPNIQRVFDYQMVPESDLSAPQSCRMNERELDVTRRFNFYPFARLMHNVNEMDNDQRAIAVSGQSGTGKSIIQDVVNAIYPPEHIIAISPTDDSSFVLAGLERRDTFMWFLPEVQRDCKLKPSDFYALISGDRLSIRAKYKDSKTEMIQASGAMFGNSMDIFAQGAKRALARRLFLLITRRVIQDKDMDDSLKKSALDEVPMFIVKCAVAYRALRKYMQERNMTNITRIWPAYYKKNCEALVANSDLMEAFLSSMHVKLDATRRTELHAFRTRFRAFCVDDMQISGSLRWEHALYESAFNQYALSVIRQDGKEYIAGVELVDPPAQDAFASGRYQPAAAAGSGAASASVVELPNVQVDEGDLMAD